MSEHVTQFRTWQVRDQLHHLREVHDMQIKNDPSRWTRAELRDLHETTIGGHSDDE